MFYRVSYLFGKKKDNSFCRNIFHIEVVRQSSIDLEQMNRTSVLSRNSDHLEQYCAWTMNPISVHNIITGSKVMTYTPDYIEQSLGLR